MNNILGFMRFLLWELSENKLLLLGGEVMKSLKWVTCVVLISMMVSMLAGCSSSKPESKTDTTSTQGTTAEEGSSKTKTTGDVVELKLGMVDSETSNYYKGAQKIAEEVAAATNGQVKITVYPNSQLGNERDMWEGATMGTIDIATAANAVISAFIPEMKVLDQPFLFDDAEQAHNVIDGELGDAISTKAEEMGIHIVGWMESGFRDVFATRPVQSLEDFKGLKIRAMENDTHIAAFNGLGAIATPMAAGDQFTALQQGTIDAAENAVCNVLSNNFYDITKNITRTHHLFVFIGVGFSDNAWNKIPEDLRDDVEAAVKKGCDAQRQYLVETNEAAEAELTKLGVSFYDIDRESLKAAIEPALADIKSGLNQDWVAMIENGKTGK
jgi:tripartite ATP-independent transporter DctP family solute receptor